ncbi:MAG: PPK2 family polyphosphate kinase [Candidatus Cyclobacteriaceae bacterium M2_1C_046]
MIQLKEISTLPPEDSIDKKKAKKKLKKKYYKKLFKLQTKFYADGRYGLLIILQGLDTAGKDGIIRHSMRSMNPMGVQVKAFGVPTEEEVKHDFLWRIYPHIPQKGMIQVFNRSYYEDILVPKIEGTLSPARIEHRFELINQLEEHLKLNGIKVLKFFLHISRDEQLDRIEGRKKKKHKKWKYSEDDEYPKEVYDRQRDVYELIINQCNVNPWHIIPADKRWYRNYITAKIIKKYLKNLDLKFPEPEILEKE